MTNWVRAHEADLATGNSDELDTFLAQYADLLLMIRSDDAEVQMRVVGFADPDALAAFTYFQEHRAEIMATIEPKMLEAPVSPAGDEKPDAESVEEARTGDPPHQAPGQSAGGAET